MKEENVGILVFSQYTLFTSFYCKCTLYLKKCTLKVHVNRQLFKVKTNIEIVQPMNYWCFLYGRSVLGSVTLVSPDVMCLMGSIHQN